MKTILAIDEAGRGAILGDLVLAGIFIPENKLSTLKKLNIKDSKQFGQGSSAIKKRLELTKKLQAEFNCKTIHLKNSTVDEAVAKKGLNGLERTAAKQLLTSGTHDEALLDGKAIFNDLSTQYPQIKAIDKADTLFLEVAAASIIAKSARDQSIIDFFYQLPQNYGEFRYKGMGYPNKATLKFIKSYYLEFNHLPSNIRTSYNWKKLNQWLMFDQS